MHSTFRITTLNHEPEVISALTTLLIGVVASGGSVSFMHPLEPEIAKAFWENSLKAAAHGECVVLGAQEKGVLIGTVTLLLDCPQNQPHRAEIAKLMTNIEHRRQGVASALVLAAERIAIELGRTLLTLDTAVEDGAADLYEGLGFQKAGVIPNYAFKPHGGLTGTIIFWKQVG